MSNVSPLSVYSIVEVNNSTSTVFSPYITRSQVFVNSMDPSGHRVTSVIWKSTKTRIRRIKETVASRIKNDFKKLTFEEVDKLNYFFSKEFGITVDQASEINRVLNSDYFEFISSIKGE